MNASMTATRFFALGLLGLVASGCEGNTAGKVPGTTDTTAAPTERTSVDAFVGKHVYFKADDNQRKIDAQVAFPDKGPWKQVTVNIDLKCPDGQCDWWDRWAYIGVVNGDARESPVSAAAL